MQETNIQQGKEVRMETLTKVQITPFVLLTPVFIKIQTSYL